jgi:predicted Zn finger-like uncharacterized protein
MIVRCTECNAAYAVDDKKIENKKFAFSCPKCGTNVVIDNRPVGKSGAAEPFFQAPASGTKGAFDDARKQPNAAVADKPGAAPLDDMMSMETGEIAGEGLEGRAGRKGPDAGMDLDFDALEGALKEEAPPIRPTTGKEPVHEDESLNLDDFATNLGIEVEETRKKPEGVRDEFEDMSFIEDVETPKEMKSPARKESRVDEGFDLESDIIEYEPPKRDRDAKRPAPAEDLIVDNEIKGDEIFSKDVSRVDDSITIDLDSLDIDLDESETKPVPSRHEEDEFGIVEPVKSAAKPKKDDEFDTTIDLETLDISLEEVEEIKKGEVVEDEERLSLEDTGLSIDELSGDEIKSATTEAPDEALDEDIKLNLMEIDPSLTVESLAAAAEKGEPLLTDEIDSGRLPEIDIERMDAAADISGRSVVQASEDYLDLEARKEFSKFRAESESAAMESIDTVPGGVVNFSVDYSLVFSRLGGVFRLLLLYSIVLIPHVVVLMVYSMLSSVLGLLNWMITLFTGFSETDFAEIQENTIRYAVSTLACAAGIVEDRPVFAGRKNIDHPLQLNIIYPVRYSRVWALLRLSFVGMFIAMLPHLLLLMILSLGALVIAIIGILCVIATKKWPNVLFDFMVRYLGYVTNVSAFMMGVIDRYPSFRFE